MIPSSENISLGKHLGAGRLCINCSTVHATLLHSFFPNTNNNKNWKCSFATHK